MRDTKTDLARDSFIAKWPNWIRWILVLPVALVGSVLLGGLWRLGNMMYLGSEPSILMDLGSTAIIGGVFVYAGTWIAPKKQFEVSVFLLVVATIISVFSVLGSALPGSSVGAGMGILHAVIAVVAAGAIVVWFHQEATNSL